MQNQLSSSAGIDLNPSANLHQKLWPRRADDQINRREFLVFVPQGWDIDRAVLVRLEAGKRTVTDYEVDFILRMLEAKWSSLD